jgi:hypothetical protein
MTRGTVTRGDFNSKRDILHGDSGHREEYQPDI